MAFNIHESIANRYGEIDEKRARNYQEQLVKLFQESPEAKALEEQASGVGGWVDITLEYGMSYLGVTPPKMSPDELKEILFDLFPRKVSTLPEVAPDIIQELQAFWKFLQREFGLANAAAILRVLDDNAAHRLEQELGNPANFGIAKSMIMMGLERGFDMQSEEGINKWVNTYNAELAAGTGLRIPLPGEKSANARKVQSKVKRAMAKNSRKKNRQKR